MPLPIDLVQVEIGDLNAGLEGGYCFSTFQRLNVDILSRARWFIRTTTGNFFFNYGASTPNADNRIYPWLRTTDGLWYVWNLSAGIWTSPRRFPLETTFGLLWIPPGGTPESALWSLDGGDGTDPSVPLNVSDTTGSMWQVIASLAGKVPVGVGTLQPSATTIGVGDTGGVDEVTLVANQLAKHTHIVNTTDRLDGSNLWSHFDPGGESPSPLPQKPIEPDASGTTTNLVAQQQTDGDQPHTNMPPYLTVYFIQPTARKYYTVPG